MQIQSEQVIRPIDQQGHPVGRIGIERDEENLIE